MRVYGIRMWETNCLVAKTDPKGQLRLFVTVGKVYATRGTKRANDPRWLAPVPVGGQIFDLVGQVQRGELDLPCLLYTSPSPRDYAASRMPSSA